MYYMLTIIFITGNINNNIIMTCPLYTPVFLSQVCTGHRLARTWFAKIDPMQIVGMSVCVYVCVCVCVRTRGY